MTLLENLGDAGFDIFLDFLVVASVVASVRDEDAAVWSQRNARGVSKLVKSVAIALTTSNDCA